MLKVRLLTAAVLIPLLLAALFYLTPFTVALVFGFFVAAGAWEWSALAGLTHAGARAAYTAALVLLGLLGIYAILFEPARAVPVLVGAALWWAWVLVELVRGARATRGLFHALPGKLAAGALVLLPCWVASVYLHAVDPKSPWVLVYVFLLVWMADTAAYAVGHLFGRVKLAPDISPGKTVEGAVGGMVAVGLLAYGAGAYLWQLSSVALAVWVALAFVSGCISIVGDLWESRFKRLAGVKHSGTLIPGHGGVLDRIDAFTAATPVFALGWYLLRASGVLKI